MKHSHVKPSAHCTSCCKPSRQQHSEAAAASAAIAQCWECSTWMPAFFASSWLANVDGMNDLIVVLYIVQFGCYQRRYEWKDLDRSIHICVDSRHKWMSSSPIHVRLIKPIEVTWYICSALNKVLLMSKQINSSLCLFSRLWYYQNKLHVRANC